jgi:hypothetical protein
MGVGRPPLRDAEAAHAAGGARARGAVGINLALNTCLIHTKCGLPAVGLEDAVAALQALNA